MSLLGLLYTSVAVFYDKPLLYIYLVVLTLLISYYYREVVKSPILLCNEGKYRNFLMKHCSIVHEKYWPTLWCFESRFQTVMASVLRSRLPPVNYKRELLQLKDGGRVALDWFENENSVHEDLATRPTVVFLPGLTGDSQADYLKTFVCQAQTLGFRCVVFNNRGKGGTPLLTPRTYCACDCDDLKEVIDHIKRKYPRAPLMGTGISLGGIILSHYLVQTGKECQLLAAMIVSIVWDVFEGTTSLQRPVLNLMLNHHLAQNLVRGIKENHHLFKDNKTVQMDKLEKSKTIKDFDTEFTSKIFGFKNIDDYYAQSCLCNKLQQIKVPVLGINAADDPFQPASAIPMKEICESSHVALLVTSRGGHIGFMEGLFPFKYTYIDRLFKQYTAAVFHHVEELHQICEDLRQG